MLIQTTTTMTRYEDTENNKKKIHKRNRSEGGSLSRVIRAGAAVPSLHRAPMANGAPVPTAPLSELEVGDITAGDCVTTGAFDRGVSDCVRSLPDQKTRPARDIRPRLQKHKQKKNVHSLIVVYFFCLHLLPFV